MMVNGAGALDLQGPLAAMWRDVYRKAGRVAEARTTELLKAHTYAYPHTLDHSHPSTNTFIWRYSPNVAMEDPGAGSFRVDDVFAAATAMAVSVTTDGGVDVQTVLASVRAGDQIYVQEEQAAANWARYTVAAAPTESATWFLFPVTPVAAAGTVPSNNTPCLIQFTLAGGGGGGGGDEPGPYVDEAGDTMTGTLVLVGATADDTALAVRLPADGWPRLRALSSGRLEWGPGGTTPPEVYLEGNAGPGLTFFGNVLLPYLVGADLGQESSGRFWGEIAGRELKLALDSSYVRIGQLGTLAPPATTGAVRLRNTAGISWRNGTNTADLGLTVDASNTLRFDGSPIGGGGGGGTGNTTMYTQTTAPAGAANSLWFNPSESA
jgi:hypothetical protein